MDEVRSNLPATVMVSLACNFSVIGQHRTRPQTPHNASHATRSRGIVHAGACPNMKPCIVDLSLIFLYMLVCIVYRVSTCMGGSKVCKDIRALF